MSSERPSMNSNLSMISCGTIGVALEGQTTAHEQATVLVHPGDQTVLSS